VVAGFEAARGRGEDRALVAGHWVEVPTYRNARRLMERARRLAQAGAAESGDAGRQGPGADR
jgi:citrate lyase subunit beta/citryl-CoA lyase